MKRLLVVLSLLLPVMASAECLTIIAADGFVTFEATQRGNPIGGSFSRFGGEVCFDDNRVVSISTWLEPASVATGSAETDAALRSAAFFATEAFSRAIFRSDDIDTGSDGSIAHGELAMKGNEHPLDVRFELNTQAAVWRMTGTLTLDRLAYDIGTGEWADTDWLAREVTVRFEVALRPE